MKIKAVCEQTGLTDRTIRYYIEEGLISPIFIQRTTSAERTLTFQKLMWRCSRTLPSYGNLAFPSLKLSSYLNIPRKQSQ